MKLTALGILTAALVASTLACSRAAAPPPPPPATGTMTPPSGAAAPASASGPSPLVIRHETQAFDPVDYWMSQAEHGDHQARLAAIVGLGLSGAAAHDSVAVLTTMLDDADPVTRRLAADALARIGADAAPARSRLEALAADDTDADARAAAAQAAATVAAGEAPAVVIHAPAASAESGPTGPTAPQAVVLAGAGASLNGTMQGLHSHDRGARLQSIRDAATYGTLATGAVGDLVRALRDDDPSIRREAASSIGAIGSSAAAPAGSVVVPQYGRALAPASLGPDGQAAIRGLADLLDDKDASVRRAAADALGRIGPPASTAASELQRAARSDDDPAVQQAAARAYALVGGR